ncbi:MULTISPECIES: hypothetical protein [Mesorhizobium]|uniref:Uncharacterized protein n=1 Tax=Rhizobium loti TaxID=381 RepID=A0A6M7U6P6_RHILI|nr:MULTISPECIES: hypothetical protein [Mesorhizobium]KRB22601.1 hypothetical protein ASE05_15515 [Mesorhizobium sp. Root172]OBQ62067.1 hypothetical protein A8145_20535 [Mesorhizobium loti]QKC71127.1 hypothetical protein EB815_19785 [Mesorhizobium loti]
MVQRPIMSDLLLAGIFTAFTMVRLLKGPWPRISQCLATGITGGVTGIFGSWTGMTLFDAIPGIA